MSETRSEYIKVYLTQGEEEEIEKAAENVDRSISNYARNKILNSIPRKVEA